MVGFFVPSRRVSMSASTWGTRQVRVDPSVALANENFERDEQNDEDADDREGSQLDCTVPKVDQCD